MARLTVLLVDDSDVDRYIVQRLLQKADCEAEIVEMPNGREALDWLRKQEFGPERELQILLDLNMPVMSGFEFLLAFSSLRTERADLQPCSVTVLSSSTHPDDMHRSIAFPFVRRHMVKMPTIDALRDLLRQITRAGTGAYEVSA